MEKAHLRKMAVDVSSTLLLKGARSAQPQYLDDKIQRGCEGVIAEGEVR